MHEVLVNRLGGLSLPRKSVVRLTDRPDMTLDVYRGRKTTMQQPDKDDMRRTDFAHVTNLGCEHHFGDLDSSQKRRPNALMHHHSSVQLIKRNRKSLMTWLHDMPLDNRGELLKSARKGGRVLREIHINNEKRVINEIHEEMTKMKENISKRKTTNKRGNTNNLTNENNSEGEDEFESDAAKLRESLPVLETFTLNEYVAVAYQDTWYPGCVEKISGHRDRTNRPSTKTLLSRKALFPSV